jgi:tripartite-type tricarboxylate transporter receptor subunit TctC
MQRRGLLAWPALLPWLAHAQSAGLQLITPYPPGGENDIGARALAPLMAELLRPGTAD